MYSVSLALSLVLLLILGGKTSAITGANTFFPDTSPGNQARSYGLVQVTGSNVYRCTINANPCPANRRSYNAQSKMKAQTTVANIYVPKRYVAGNQLVSFNIIEACGYRNRDNDAGNGWSEFYVKNITTGGQLAFKSSATASDCNANGTIAVSFNPDDLNSASTGYAIARTIEDGIEYYIYSFRAEGVMNENGSDKRYLNAFQLERVTSDTFVGISDTPVGCDDITFTISCPGKRWYDNGKGIDGYKSWVYSSFYGPTAAQFLPQYSQQIRINNNCSSEGAISFYDLDANDNNLAQNLTLSLTKAGAPVSFPAPLPIGPQTSMPQDAIKNWEPGWAPFGVQVIRPHPDVVSPATRRVDHGGNNNEYMDIPAGDPTFTALGVFEKDVDYVLSLANIDSDNAFQMLPTIAHCQSSSEPVGYIDSCILSGRNVVLYGWAYDNDGGGATQPQVSVSATGQAVQTVGSAYDYRSGDINTFLDSNGYGSDARDNRYGFRVTYSGMSKGNSYTISGTNLNVGTGSDKALGINRAAGPPSNGVAGSSGFPGGTIPDACLPPQAEPPTCTASGGTYFIGISSKLTTATATNVNNSGAMTITSARYVIRNDAGTQIASGSDTSNLNIPARSGATNGTRGYDGEDHTINAAGQYQATWTFDWSINGVSGTITCASPATVDDDSCTPNPCDPACLGSPIPCVTYQPPTCGAAPGVVGDVGLAFNARATINNPNPVVLPITSVTYVTSGPYIGINRTGSASDVGDINASTNRAYNFSDNINRPSMIAGGANNSHTLTWTVVSAGGTITCASTVTIVVMPPTCVAEPSSIGTGISFGPRVNVDNPNNAANMKMNTITYIITPGNYTGAVPTPISDLPPGNRIHTASNTTINSAGEYTTNWTVTWEVTPMTQTFDCGDDDGVPDTIVSNQPYARFYGNDIFAGGGFGESCTTSGLSDALGYGTNSTHSTYLGTASELAVFAVGQIQNVLPGAQRNRSSASELAFANTGTIDLATGRFGGGFGSVMCSPDYYAKSTSAVGLADAGINDLSSLASGSYAYGNGAGTTVLTTGAGIADGRRVVVYIDGDAQITDSAGRFGYADAVGNWASFSDIPSLYIIASGNIYVDADVSTMDGVYVAQPRPASTDTGQIYSCSRNNEDPLSNLIDRTAGGNAEFILNECDNKLTVNGSFMASKVHLLRSIGTVVQGKPYDTYTDLTNNIAEIFRFTPELYLIEGGGLPPRSTNAKIDSIIALPPAF